MIGDALQAVFEFFFESFFDFAVEIASGFFERRRDQSNFKDYPNPKKNEGMSRKSQNLVTVYGRR